MPRGVDPDFRIKLDFTDYRSWLAAAEMKVDPRDDCLICGQALLPSRSGKDTKMPAGVIPLVLTVTTSPISGEPIPQRQVGMHAGCATEFGVRMFRMLALIWRDVEKNHRTNNNLGGKFGGNTDA